MREARARSVVFFDWCGHHRHLHSFPTRRSSDLPLGALTLAGSPLASIPIASIALGDTPLSGIDINPDGAGDRKSTRLNSSHSSISYAVLCLKKKSPAGARLQEAQEVLQPCGQGD